MTRAARLTTTRTGLQIGVAYVAPPPRMGSQAERIQHLLLHRPRAPGAGDYLAAAIALVCLHIADACRESDLIALYRAFRRKGAGRFASLRGALRCWLP